MTYQTIWKHGRKCKIQTYLETLSSGHACKCWYTFFHNTVVSEPAERIAGHVYHAQWVVCLQVWPFDSVGVSLFTQQSSIKCIISHSLPQQKLWECHFVKIYNSFKAVFLLHINCSQAKGNITFFNSLCTLRVLKWLYIALDRF